MSTPLGTSSSLTHLRRCLAIGCGAGLLLYAGVVLRRCLARPRPPPRPTCPMADNTIALLRDLHDGPFRFGDPTPFAVAARAEATRRIRRQQRERRRLRRRMRSELCRTKGSHHLPSRRTAKAAAAAAAKDRGGRVAGFSATEGGRRSANSLASLCAAEHDAAEGQRDTGGYRDGAFDTNERPAAKNDGAREISSRETSLISSSSMSSAYDSDYSLSRSSSTSTHNSSSYGSRISSQSLTRSTTSTAASQDGALSLLAGTTGSTTSPDGVLWVKSTFDGGSVSGGGFHSAHHATQQPQSHSHQPLLNDPAGSCGSLSHQMVPRSVSNPQFSSCLHSKTSAAAGQGSRCPAQQLWCGTSSPFVSVHGSVGMPQAGVDTAFSSTFGCDGSRSPEAAYAAGSAFMPGAAPSLPVSGRGGGAEDEEPYRYTASALMYGPPLFATEMDVTDALAELRNSACGSGERHSSSCIGGGACNAANTASSPNVTTGVASTGGGIKALMGSSINPTYVKQQQQFSHHHRSWSHPRGQGRFAGSLNTASVSAVFPTGARHAVHHCGGGSGSSGGPPPQPHHHQSSGSGYHRISSRTSVRRSANWSPASSQWLPEALPTAQPGCCYDSAPRSWGAWGSEGAPGESTISAGDGSFTRIPTETPVSQASSALRRSMTGVGHATHSSGHGNSNSNVNHSFRSVNSALRGLRHHGRHRCGGRVRRWGRRCRRQVRRRLIASCAAVQLCVMHMWLAMRRGWSALGSACAKGCCWGIRQWRESASAASRRVLSFLRRLRWFSATPRATTAADGGCAAAASVPSSEAAKRRPGRGSPGVDAAAEAVATEAKRGGLLLTDTADTAIDKIVQLLEPTPGRVPTVVVIRAPLGYDVSTDAASLWKALHLDSSSSEEGLVDIIIMEELKTGPLPPVQAKAAATAAGASSQVASFPENPVASPMLPCVGTAEGEKTRTATSTRGDRVDRAPEQRHDLSSFMPATPVSPATSSLPQRRQPQGPATSPTAATATARAPAQLRISFEVYPAHLFYSFIIRAAVLQEKDWALRRAAAELFGGSAEIEGSGAGLGASAAATVSPGGVVGATPGSPLSLAHALSFTFGAPAPLGESSHGNSAMTHVNHHHPHHGPAAGAGSTVGFENYCLSPLSPGHFCRTQASPKPTAPVPPVCLTGGGGGAGVGSAGAPPGTAGGTAASPAALPASAFSPAAAPTSPQVVVRLSESYSFPALPPQMVMSPLLGTQSGLGAPLGALPAGLSGSAYSGGGSALTGAGAVTGTSGTTVAGAAATSGPARRIISDSELLFYIHVLRTTVGDGVTTTALPSSRASEAEGDDADAESADAVVADMQRGILDSAQRSPRAPSGTSGVSPMDRNRSGVEEDSGGESEDLTLLDLRQRQIEPQVVLRYRFRVFQKGSRSRKALDAAVLYTQDHVEPWYEEAKAMLQALPATASCQALSSLSTPSLQATGGSPALRPSENAGWRASAGGGGEATTGLASARPQRRSGLRSAGLPLLSLGSATLASTLELDQADCRTPAVNRGPVQLPAWALEVLVRRESMRETLVRDLKEKAFRVCAVPLPDMRVHCILPPAVPRYATAHARGFPLSRTFAEEVLSQQRALQFILLQREQENQRVIAARIRQEQRRQERRERKRRERRAREEAWRRAQQERQQRRDQQQKRSVASGRREAGQGERLKEWLARCMNPATLMSCFTSMMKQVSVESAGRGYRGFSSACTHVPPQCSDSVCTVCTKADAAYRQEAASVVPFGESSVSTPPPPQHRHGYSAANGGFSPGRLQSAAPERSMRVGAALGQDESDRVGYGRVESSDSIGSVLQHHRLAHEPSSPTQVYVAGPPPGLQSIYATDAIVAAAMSGQLALVSTEVDTNFLVDGSGSIPPEASSNVSLMTNAVGMSAPSCAAAAEPHLSESDAGGEKGSSGSREASASAEAPSLLPQSPAPRTVTAQTMSPTLPKRASASPPSQSRASASINGSPRSPPPPPHISQGDHSGGEGSGGAARLVSMTSASSSRSSHWTAVHTATNANTCVTPPAASDAGSSAPQVNSSGSSGVYTSSAVSHGSAQATPASIGSLQKHFGACSATTPATTVTTSSFSVAGAAGLHCRITSAPDCDFPSMPLPPAPPPLPVPSPPLPLAERSSSSPPFLFSSTSPSSYMVSVPDALTATLATTRNASLGASAGEHYHPHTHLQSQPQPQPHTRQSRRSLQSPALPAAATSLLNVEDAIRLAASSSTMQSDVSSHNDISLISDQRHESEVLPEDGEMATASLTPVPLAVPNNSMYGTFDAYYGHSVVTPQAVMLRQQTQAVAASIASSSMRALTSPRHQDAANSAAACPATVKLSAERGTQKGDPHSGGPAGCRDGRSPPDVSSNAASLPVAAAPAVAEGTVQQWQPTSQQHLQALRSAPRRTGSGLLPYTYSADSVSSMYGTTHYPLYQYPDDPSGTAAAAYTGVSPPTASAPGVAAMGGSGGASASALAGSSHTGATGLYAYSSSGYSGSHVTGASAAGVPQVCASAGNSTALGGGGGDRRPGSSVGGVGRLENGSPHSQSPRVVDSPMDMNASTTVPVPLPLVQNTHMNRLKQYNKLLSDLLGVAGGPMRSGISFYYTYGDATALLYNASIRAPCDENILELLEHHQWVRKKQLRHANGGGASSDSGGAADGRVPSDDKAATDTSSGSYTAPSSATDRFGASCVPATLAGIGASPPPPPLRGSSSAAKREASADDRGVCSGCEASSAARTAATLASEDEGCSYLEYSDLAGLQDTMDALETEQMEAQRARNMRFYSIFEHLHHAYRDTVLEATGSGSASAKSVALSPVTPAAATGSFDAGLTGGVGMEHFSSPASAAGAAGAERHTVTPHGVALATVPGSGTPSLGALFGVKGAADVARVSRGPQRLWSRVCAFAAWAGSLVGLTRKSRGGSMAAGGASGTGAGTCWPSSPLTPEGAPCGFDPATLAAYFPGERIVTFGNEWCIASRLDMQNGHFGLSPLQVWMAARYSRRFAGEVYLMDVIAAGSDPYYPAVRVLDEVVAHAVLYYHNHSLRDFVEDLAAELGLVYVPQTQWGRRALGLPDQEAEVQELDGLLHTATRRRQDRRRRQRAQGKRPQRCRSRDGRGGAFEKGRAATAGSCCDRHRSSSLQAPRRHSAATEGSSGGGACDTPPPLLSLVSDGDDTPSVPRDMATTRSSRPPPLRQHQRSRRQDHDRLEDEEMAEYKWVLLQNRDQEEDEEVFYGATAAAAAGLGGGDINIAPHVYDAVLEREVYDERMLLRELDHLKEFLVDNRNVLSSAMLTTAGSNSLEAVFGVPATVFPFLLCARESVPFVASIFESLSYHYGSLTYDNFSKYTFDVYHCDRPEVLRHTPRMFRMVNKSRRGCITYEELCRWMARKLSCGNNIQPNGHLVATSMSLRLPLALVAESRNEWDAYRCVLKSLSDCDEEEY
ncbi:hypothetical protein JIQ42_07785 [Leishmania sp. Namibia]|uniref:hypothetical protein n=1 Tax=Leishmania sp. Namibia TaxID=2802991 RepID=UPI001B66CCA5|nr:hypothetical protein JIQ42_07785 [Leishmania sp. Namibia]